MSVLFSPVTIGPRTARNRILMAPMCMYSATDGLANEFHRAHYAARCLGGVGVLMVEATAVEPRGRISDNDLGLWNDAQAEALAPIAAFAEKHGALPAIQIAHAGRKAQDDPRPIAPSPIPFDGENCKPPAEMTPQDIADVTNAFVNAARRAAQAGFKLVEIHAAHGYLLNEFLSPLSNKRADAYGQDRARLPREVVSAVRAALPQDVALGMRVSATDWVEGGNSVEMMENYLRTIAPQGLDILHVSTGGLQNVVPPRIHPGFQIPFAERLKQSTGLPVIGGGLVEAPTLAEEIVANHRADLVFLGRALLRDPFWPLHAAKELGADIEWPRQYLRAKR